MSDSKAQDSLEGTLRTETQRDTGDCDSDLVSSWSGSECSSSLESESDDPTPPPPKVPKAVSYKCSKSKTTARYRAGKHEDYVEKDCTHYTAKLLCLVPDVHGVKGAFCKSCRKYYCGSRGLPKGSNCTFITKPFTKWSKATGSNSGNKLLKHQQSTSHRQAVARAEMNADVERRGSAFTQLHNTSEIE